MRKRHSVAPLGEAEMEVLQHVWDMGRASVAEVHDRILQDRKLAYTTVMSIMRRLHEKGYLEYEQEGAAYIYRPVRKENEVQQSLLSGFMAKVFRGSPVNLVETLVKGEPMTEEDLERIRDLIDEVEAAGRKAARKNKEGES